MRSNTYSGTVFGKTVEFFGFLIVDTEATVLSGLDNPTTPGFASAGDFLQITFSFTNSTSLSHDEYASTPVQDRRAFQIVPEPSNFLLGGLALTGFIGRRKRNV